MTGVDSSARDRAEQVVAAFLTDSGDNRPWQHATASIFALLAAPEVLRALAGVAAPAAAEPAVWWSPTERKVFGRIPMRMEEVYTHELPADAVRLVPEFAGTALTPSTRLGWLGIVQSYLEENGVDAEPLLVHLGVSGELAAGAVPDTGQAREPRPVYPQVWCDDSSGPNGIGGTCVLGPGHLHRDGLGGEWPVEPSGDTVQAPDVAGGSSYRSTRPYRTGELVNLADDLLRLDSMVTAAPADYPGLPRLRRERDAVAAEIDRTAAAALLRRVAEIERRNPEVPQTIDVDEVRALLGTDTQRDPEEARRG